MDYVLVILILFANVASLSLTDYLLRNLKAHAGIRGLTTTHCDCVHLAAFWIHGTYSRFIVTQHARQDDQAKPGHSKKPSLQTDFARIYIE